MKTKRKRMVSFQKKKNEKFSQFLRKATRNFLYLYFSHLMYVSVCARIKWFGAFVILYLYMAHFDWIQYECCAYVPFYIFHIWTEMYQWNVWACNVQKCLVCMCFAEQKSVIDEERKICKPCCVHTSILLLMSFRGVPEFNAPDLILILFFSPNLRNFKIYLWKNKTKIIL